MEDDPLLCEIMERVGDEWFVKITKTQEQANLCSGGGHGPIE